MLTLHLGELGRWRSARVENMRRFICNNVIVASYEKCVGLWNMVDRLARGCIGWVIVITMAKDTGFILHVLCEMDNLMRRRKGLGKQKDPKK